MHGSINIKLINAKQAIEIQAYKNSKIKLQKTNAAIGLTRLAGIKN
jgi:hypothetical protein